MSKEYVLRDIGEIYDGPHATPKRQTEGKYFLNISSLDNGRLQLRKSDHISDIDYEKWTRRITPQANDLLFSYETRLGEAALMPGGIKAALGRRMALLRPDTSKVDPGFLLYKWLSPQWQALISERTLHGATVNRIPIRDIPDWPITLPPLSQQNAIASILRSLDDKIAANQRTIQSADSLRNALWDKLLKTNTESLPLSSLAEFINGRAFTKNATGTGRVVARIAELNSGIGSNTVFNDIEVHQNHVVLPGELLFAWSGTLMTKRWPYDEAIVNQHIFKVLPISKFDLWALELIIQSQIHYFQMIAAGKATTMGHIKRADLDKTVEVPTSIPDKLNMLGNTLWMLATQAEQENQTLARTRDELLPLLMSGKITVRDAEEASAEVGVDKHEVKE